MAPTKWGVAGCGKISHDFLTALKHEGPERHLVAVVAARELSRARQYAADFGAARACEGYAGLATASDVDIVYVGTINTAHYEVVKMLLKARKPVLCEKPMCMSVADTEELVNLARENNTFLMEGVWSRHFPLYQELRRAITSNALGEVRHLALSFGFPLWEVPNVRERVLGGGAMFAIGLYALQLAMVVFGSEEQPRVQVLSSLSEEEVEKEVVFSLQYPGGGLVSCSVSTSCVLPNRAFVVGTAGTAEMADFWAPTRLSLPGNDLEAPLDPSDLPYLLPGSQGLKYQANEVARCLQAGLTESPHMSLEDSLSLSRLVESVRRGAGVTW